MEILRPSYRLIPEITESSLVTADSCFSVGPESIQAVFNCAFPAHQQEADVFLWRAILTMPLLECYLFAAHLHTCIGTRPNQAKRGKKEQR